MIFQAYKQTIQGQLTVDFVEEAEALAYAAANQMEVRSYEPPPPPAVENIPNWQGFLDALDVPELGGNGLFGLGIYLDRNLFLDIYQLLLRLEDAHSLAEPQVKEWRTFSFMYGMAIVLFSPEQKTLIEQALTANYIPIPNL